MTEKGMENNKVTVIGTIVSGFTFSHAVFGEGFYLVDLLVNRLSEQADLIPLMISERLTDGLDGLVSVPVMIVAGVFMIIAYVSGHMA